MKSVNVVFGPSIKDDPYGYSNTKFAFCTKPDKNKKVTQVGSAERCRENLVEILKNCNNSKSYKKLDLTRTRLLIILRTPTNIDLSKIKQASKTADVQMQASLKLVNFYERKHGWALTRLYKADTGELTPHSKLMPTDMTPYIHAYVTVGSNKWMKSQQYISLYLLLLRLGRSGFKSKFKNQTELNKEMAGYARKTFGDGSHIKAIYKYIDIILANQDELLEKRKNLFKKEVLSDNSSGYHEGVKRLCTGKSRDSRLQKKFEEICGRYKI